MAPKTSSAPAPAIDDSLAAKRYVILPLAFFGLAALALFTIENSIWTKAISGTALAICLTMWLRHVQQYAKSSSNKDGKAFNNTVIGCSRILSNKDSVLTSDQVSKSVENYENLFSGARSNVGAISSEESIKLREKKYAEMVASFYDLVSDFYEYGWGQSFHFAPRFKGETFKESILRSEYHLASSLQLAPGKKCLDMGCGVGGPMRNIARFSGANVEGITINEYQAKNANRYNKEKGLENQCKVNVGDFMKLPHPADTFDAIYAIEATCHAPNKLECFKQAFRVLKPGGYFAGYEWCVNNNYDKNNKMHVALKEGIEVGNGLPTLATPEQVVAALQGAGFEVITHYDNNAGAHSDLEVPWYDTLNGKMTLEGFRMTSVGRYCTHVLVNALEFMKIAPKGSARVSQILRDTADDLVEAGKLGVFTPDYFFLARKPVAGTSKAK